MSKFEYVNSVSELMRSVVKRVFSLGGNCAIDATLGHGNDALFLSESFKNVYAFEIQTVAVEAFKNILQEKNINNIKVFNKSFEKIDLIKEEVDLVVYNLGYLPGGDKSISTEKNSTINSLKKAISIVKTGYIIIAIYPGHEEGKIEAEAVIEFVSKLNTKQYAVMHHKYINRLNNPPELIVIEKR